MANLNRSLPRVDSSRFAMIPRTDVPRSTFVTSHTYKTTFDAGYLVPCYLDEVLPGDVHRGEMTVFCRLATPLFPIMDELEIETFFFFVPNRLVWTNWVKMMGERANPGDSISYTVPTKQSPVGGFGVGTLYDYFGLPTVGQLDPAGDVAVNALPLRGYYLIYNEWFRDQNLQGSIPVPVDDGPDSGIDYHLVLRNKKHDYFTSALPWPLKGGQEVQLPIGGVAPVTGIALPNTGVNISGQPANYSQTDGIPLGGWLGYWDSSLTQKPAFRMDRAGAAGIPEIYADLSQATGATINAMRLAVATQQLLERDARSGTRYTELLRAHFGVTPEDYRLQRPEYIGGGRTRIQTQAIPQTSGTGATGTSSPLGALGAAAVGSDQHQFQYSATEHGFIIGLINVRADLTYQQGLRRMWTRQTRYDYYWPAFAHLGEQIIRNDELYCTGLSDGNQAFGYQERWAEYRYRPSQITGLFRSTSAGNIDEWHLAQEFSSLPVLNSTFIEEHPPLSRVLAAGDTANGMQILMDSVFKVKSTRPMPTYSIPGLVGRF